MSSPSPRIKNDYVAALVALAATFCVLYLIGGMIHPYLLGLGDPPVAGSH